jgi:hypothetical protein
MTKNEKNPYFPQLPPEREVIKGIWDRVNEQRGTNGCCRIGEQYILTCQCGELQVTCDTTVPTRFDKRHENCRKREAA